MIKERRVFSGEKESQQRDSNPRPADYESAALPLSYTGSMVITYPEHLENNRIIFDCQDCLS